MITTQTKPFGRPLEHPWHRWFDGRAHVLLRGRDYRCNTKSFAVMVRTRMALDKYKASVYRQGGVVLILPRRG